MREGTLLGTPEAGQTAGQLWSCPSPSSTPRGPPHSRLTLGRAAEVPILGHCLPHSAQCIHPPLCLAFCWPWDQHPTPQA